MACAVTRLALGVCLIRIASSIHFAAHEPGPKSSARRDLCCDHVDAQQPTMSARCESLYLILPNPVRDVRSDV